MECSADVVLQVRDMDALHCCLERIRTLFNVRTEIVSVDDVLCCAPEQPGLATGYPPPGGRSVRLKLWADTASKPSALKASKVSVNTGPPIALTGRKSDKKRTPNDAETCLGTVSYSADELSRSFFCLCLHA
ncbi:hypothetical protein MRX96_025915 [Rhipicephalus microplus]